MRVQRAMKVTTVRFGADLWRLLEAEAGRDGVSVSQYIREAALARAAAAAGARGEQPFELLMDQSAPAESRAHEPTAPGRSAVVRRAAADQVGSARALTAQSEQALRHARSVTERSQETVRQTGRGRMKPR